MQDIPIPVRRHAEIERKIHAALETERAKRDAEPRRELLSISEIGRCVRDLWAARNGVPSEDPLDGQMLLTFAHGEHVEALIVESLRSAGWTVVDKENGTQIRAVMSFDDRPLASGRLDGMIQWGSSRLATDWRVLEVKSANAKQFEKLLKAGSIRAWKPEYYDQVTGYMGAGGYQQCVFIVFCKDDSRIHAEMIFFNEARYDELVLKALIALDSDLPDRPAEAKGKSSALCRWCPRSSWCYAAETGVSFDD